MEKQPIDDLFSRKLQHAEVKPGGDAWARVQTRKSVTQATPLWRYAAVAASLLVVISLFGWWVMQTRVNAVSTVAATKRIALSPSEKIARIERATVKPKQLNRNALQQSTQDVIQTRSELVAVMAEKNRSVKQEIAKDVVLQTSATPEPFVAKIPSAQDKADNLAKDVMPAVLVAKDTTPKMLPSVAERTLVVSIAAENFALQTNSTESVQASGRQSTKGGLGGFLRKVKRLKDGDAFALGNETTTKTDRHGFTKVLDEVKESISNNTTEK